MSESRGWWPAVTIFVGSFLLFGVQPMVGRTLLPSFGGTAAVWTVCLAAYQSLLLAGYFYAHKLGKMDVVRQRRLHLVLLGVAVVWTGAFALGRPFLKQVIGNSSQPALEVLFCVLVFVGLPYVLLSANSTLIQAWVAGARGGSHTKGTKDTKNMGRGVYRLYAVSNLGSLLGLLAYPLVLEPYTTLSQQWWGMGVAILGYAVLMSRVGGSHTKCTKETKFFGDLQVPGGALQRERPTCMDQEIRSPESEVGSRTILNTEYCTLNTRILWLVLPGVSVFTLNAVTTHLTLDVMPLPLLWAVLLGLFLLSYVVGFSEWSRRLMPWLAGGVVVAVVGLSLTRHFTTPETKFTVILGSGLLFCFAGASFLHSWLYQLRPETGELTRYYLYNALGGAVGGLIASLGMPLMFNSVVEYPVAVAVLLVAVAGYVLQRAERRLRVAPLISVGVVVVAGVVFALSLLPEKGDRPVVCRKRGFFGTLQVLEAKARVQAGEGYLREFVHGSTVHGLQALLPGRERMPTTYFTPRNGGYAITGHHKYRSGEPMRVNILGLGVGVTLCYGRTNDFYRCYEISPEALEVACNTNLFTFVSGCPAEVELAMQDARKGLERELAEGVEPYDVIMVDAFTGDNLPYHLSTREAFELYFKMLKPDGILAVNISNWHLELVPFVKAVGDTFGCPMLVTATENNFAQLEFAAKFAFFSRTPERMAPPPEGVRVLDLGQVRSMVLPTDERGSFVGLISW